MKPFHRTKATLIGAILLLATCALGAEKSPWRFEAGFGARNQTPLVLVGGFGYKNVDLRLQGMGFHKGANDYWCGFRGSLLWTFLKDRPFQVDLGIGGGYEFAEAPNGMHKALNQANEALYLYPYNFKEVLDVSAEVWTHIYGVYTQISVPVYKFMDHDTATFLWGVGYMVQF